MFIEIMRASLFSGLPIFIISYAMVSRAILSNRLGHFSDSKSLQSAMKNMSKEYKEDKKAKTNMEGNSHLILNKWLYFGGGFYGLMAFTTYFFIEAKEIIEFIGKLFNLNWSQLWSSVSFNLLIDLFINAIRNLIDAFVWFHYWYGEINMKNGWYWLIAAYLGYLLGARLAERYPLRIKFKHVLKAFEK